MKRMIVMIVALALIAAACGDDDDATTTTAAPGTTGASATTAAPADSLQAAADACTPGQVDGDLSFYNWTEYIDPELIEAFEAEYDVEVIETFYDSNETMLAQVDAGGAVYDLIVPSDYMVSIMAEEGLLIEVNDSAITNLGNLDATFTGLPYDPNDTYSVPYQWGTTGIGFSYEALGEDFTPSWSVIFDPDPSYAGEISLLDDPRETLGAALKYLGYSLNTTNQAELDEAVELIRGVKDSIKLFDSTTFDDNLVEGETLVAHGWNGGFLGAYDGISTDDYDAYEDFGYFIPQEGGVAWVDTMAIPMTAEHVCTAHTFIDFLLDAENGAALTNWNFYASPNTASEEFIDPEILEDESIYPSDETFANLEFIADTGDFEINYQDALTAIKN